MRQFTQHQLTWPSLALQFNSTSPIPPLVTRQNAAHMPVIGRGLHSSGGMWCTTVRCLQAKMQRKSVQISHIRAVGTSNLTQLGAVGSGATSKQIFYEMVQGFN